MGGEQYDVAVVMPTFNSASTIADAVTAVLAQETNRNWQFVVADNGSTDGTVAIISHLISDVRRAKWVDASARPGSNGARNVGVESSNAPSILFCDGDDVVTDGWLDALAEGLETYDLVGGRLDEDSLNDSHTEERLVQPRGLPTTLGYLPWVVGANMGVRREALAAVGGFDESWNAAGDDVDLSWRLQQAGFSIGYIDSATVLYRHRDSLVSIFLRSHRYMVAESRLLSIYREHGASWRGPAQSAADWARGIALLPGVLVDRKQRRRVVWTWGALTGRVVGTLRHRVMNL